MQIQQITVTAARTFPHPYEQYSNLRPEVAMVATLDPEEDPAAAIKTLQAKAEGLVEDHKNLLLKQLEDIQLMTQRQAEINRLEEQLKSAQRRLDGLRENASPLIGNGSAEEI